MNEHELVVDAGDVRLPATLSLPEHVRRGVITMHPAASGDRDYFLLTHVAATLVPEGFAVLRYDRRPNDGIDDIPFSTQAADALAAMALLRERIGDVPTGIWGYSQGTWGATLAAADAPEDVGFLILVAAPGVSPAEQMRYGTIEQLIRNGYGPGAIAELGDVRMNLEGFLRGDVSHEAAQAAITRATDRAWFPLVYLPTELPADATWTDMDFDPAPIIRRVLCPVLLVYGSEDEWTPVEPSVDVWRSSTAPITVEILPGRGHAPIEEGTEEVDPAYERLLVRWLNQTLP